MRVLALTIVMATVPASADWIDSDTPLNKRTTKSQVDGTTYHLVSKVQVHANRPVKNERILIPIAFSDASLSCCSPGHVG
jgi:hypothetical protein